MVKFSKELEAQLIPEWKDAFIDYWQLKKQIKKIKFARLPKQAQGMIPSFGCSIFDPFCSMAKKISINFLNFPQNIADISQVKSKSIEDGPDDPQIYQSELSQLFSEEDEVRTFFERIDEELNKVNEFYQAREVELVERGESLTKQLQALIELKQILEQRRLKASLSRSSAGLISFRSWPFPVRHSEFSNDNKRSSAEAILKADEAEDVEDLKCNSASDSVTSTLSKIIKKGGKHKTYVNTATTRRISTINCMLLEDLITNHHKKDGSAVGPSSSPDHFINKKMIQCAEKTIRGAFVELYRGLFLLKTYSSLNMVAFAKILKKFDKVSNQKASTSYLRVVKQSHFITSDKVVRLMDEVESIFTEHFTSNDRKKAMKYLRPQHQKDSHMVTFFVGLFTGCFVSLFSIFATLAHMSGVFSVTKQGPYVEIVYPVFSMFTLLSLHMFVYGCNLFMWKRSRINYNFIFEFNPSTVLKYRDAFLICTTSMTAVVGAMIIHLILRARVFSSSQVDAIPGILLLIFVAILICPLEVFYRSTRYCFIGILRNIVCSPFCKVLMVDFFMADQLTSQIPLLRYMESTACYFTAGIFNLHRKETCESGRLARELVYIISFLPYYWRAMQCGRRWVDERELSHLANMGKYLSAMVAAGARITYCRQPNNLGLAIVLITSFGATFYQLYWDFVKDWGLLNPNSINFWLRDDLILKNKAFYYVSIVVNIVLRVAWVETVLRLNIGDVESRLLDFLLASLEVIRRGHWNFYRLENEHLNNVGKFRAVKAVPLPFRETDCDG